MRIGFDNDKYLALQAEHIRERIGQFGGKLYLEFGGKLFDDYHASRVLPGFQPDSKIRMLQQMAEDVEIIIAINANDIEKNKVRGDLGITYDEDVLRLLDIFRSMGFATAGVVITRFENQPNALAFRHRLDSLGIKSYLHYPIAGYPYDTARIVSSEGYGKNEFVETTHPLVVVTAFLPVYVSVKKKLGQRAGNEYASNLLTLVVLLLGAVSLLCMLFPSAVIYTQSFYSDQSQMATSVFFFQFFAIQIVFYGCSAIVSGLLNASRDYLWSSIAPVANNLIVIVTFLAYSFVAPYDQQLALYIIAIGNPAGVFIQMAIQLPALKRNGIRIRPRVNLRDPSLRETLGIGVPAVLVMLCSFAIVSVQNAASYNFADNGPSILAYARLWFTLPYSFLAVPITTAMFTELSDMQAEGNMEGVKRGIVSGTNQILFFMIPFAMYLAVFSMPLVTLYHAGAFTMENVSAIATYLAVWAVALPLYGVNTYLQKTFSSLRRMGVFAGFNFIAGAVQIGLTMFAASHSDVMPISSIAVAEALFYLVLDVCLFGYLRRTLGPFGLRSVARALATAVLLGGAGAAAGGAVLWLLQTLVSPLSGSIVQALAYVMAGGLVALAVTFVPACKLNVPEAAFINTIVRKIGGKLGR